jgi:antitoxin (DNA-binding transcriptional repressor) of toxin-antitoxin stability system
MDVTIVSDGKPVAQISPPPPERRQVRFDSMRGKPGWDDPIDYDRFLSGDF